MLHASRRCPPAVGPAVALPGPRHELRDAVSDGLLELGRQGAAELVALAALLVPADAQPDVFPRGQGPEVVGVRGGLPCAGQHDGLHLGQVLCAQSDLSRMGPALWGAEHSEDGLEGRQLGRDHGAVRIAP